MKREFRFVNAELRAEKVGEKRVITGYAAKFNKKSDDLGGFREIIKPGAFSRSLKEGADVRMLINHDANRVLGRTAANTLDLEEDNVGLKFRCELPDTSYARDLSESVNRGDISQCSFGFITRKQAWVQDKDADEEDCYTRELHDVDLFDTSAVTFPAYPDTEVQHGRSFTVTEIRMFPDGVPEDIAERRGSAHLTKKVAGEDLSAHDFVIAQDPNKTETWHLPWHFSTEEKTKSHLRDALARFNQVKGLSDSEKSKAWSKLVHLCKAHDIEVNEEKSAALDLETAKARTRLAEITESL
jgi:HK97 family phage prohead protease